MRNFILFSLAASIACSNEVPKDGKASSDGSFDNSSAGSDDDGRQGGGKPKSEADADADAGTESEPAETDNDADGWSVEAGDCDDADDRIHPDAMEVCDGIDNNCDAAIDDGDAAPTAWYVDTDRDGYGIDESVEMACEAPTTAYASQGGDCDDSDDSVYPLAPEVCDFQDNDCDATIDEGVAPTLWYLDTDRDGYGLTSTEELACEAPSRHYVAVGGDCQDEDPEVNPGAEELCNTTDTDCDGSIGTGIATWTDDDGTIVDMTEEMASTEGVVTLGSSGTLRICEGEWTTRLSVRGDDVTIKGVGGAEAVLLDGNGSGATIVSRDTNERIVVRELTITGGDAEYGGGIRSAGGEVIVEDAFIQDNQAVYGGGGIYIAAGTLSLMGSEVSGNTLTDTRESTHGAGIRVVTGTATIEDSTIYGNAGEGDVYGGGVSSEEADLTFINSVVEDNEATINGGGIAVGGGNVYLTDSRVRFNEAGAYGGGVKVSGSLVMTDSLIKDNVAEINGGGAYVAMGDGTRTPMLVCTADIETVSGFRSNRTIEGLGGAVYSASSHFEIESNGCDWGADTTENSPEDVRTRNWVGNAHGDASFECNASRGCGEDDDMWTRLR